jgi:predicted nucleic-acid-binding protein
MLGIDTNVLVRFVTRDEAAQAERARRVLGRAATSGERLHVDVIVLCELAWVLRSGYGLPRERICQVLQALLETPELVVEDADLARRALKDYSEGRGGFADAFIAHRNRRAGCDATLTFDERLARAELFRQA